MLLLLFPKMNVPLPEMLMLAPLIGPPLRLYVPAETLIVDADSVPLEWLNVVLAELIASVLTF